MSFNENEEEGNGDGDVTNTVDKELIDSIVNEPLGFDNLGIEEDFNDLDNIKNMCEHYAKHIDSDASIKNKFEYQFFECIYLYDLGDVTLSLECTDPYSSLFRILLPSYSILV